MVPFASHPGLHLPIHLFLLAPLLSFFIIAPRLPSIYALSSSPSVLFFVLFIYFLQQGSFGLKAQQNECLFQSRLLHKCGVHVLPLPERVQSLEGKSGRERGKPRRNIRAHITLLLDVRKYFGQVRQRQELCSEVCFVSAGESKSLPNDEFGVGGGRKCS